MRASLRAEYGIDLSAPGLPMDEVADLVAWLPPGSALWMSWGGPASITREHDALRWVDYRLRVLSWRQTEDGKTGRNAPKPPPKLKTWRERDAEDDATTAKADAWAARQAARAAAREQHAR